MKKDELYSLIYVELYNMTVLGRYRRKDTDFIQKELRNKLNKNICLYYDDVTHGYSGEWRVCQMKKSLFNHLTIKKNFMYFNMNDKKISEHRKIVKEFKRKDSINKLLN